MDVRESREILGCVNEDLVVTGDVDATVVGMVDGDVVAREGGFSYREP